MSFAALKHTIGIFTGSELGVSVYSRSVSIPFFSLCSNNIKWKDCKDKYDGTQSHKYLHISGVNVLEKALPITL